jgi:phosphatidate cytidylyltransferase
VTAIARRWLGIPAFSWSFAAIYGLVIATVAQLGDLMESMIKRDCERKDASQAVPGFGGVLDVLDSIMFAGPVAYALWLSFGP